MTTSIDFSAQFGGRDAADAFLPHFKALKRAARDASVSGFSFPKLAFILRVDGEISTYGFCGAANVDIDTKGDYVSVDIGITHEDRKYLKKGIASNRIIDAITASIDLLNEIGDTRLRETDFDALRAALRFLCERYRNEIVE